MNESSVISSLTSADGDKQMTYWGYKRFSTPDEMAAFLNAGTNTVYILRDRAMITVENKASDIASIQSAVCNGLEKIDCLGLRTLSILEEVAEQLGKPYKWFYTIPTDDKATFDMMKNLRLNGVFQFEGQALQIIVKQMGVNHFDDIVAITALAWPGALNSGGTARYIKYSTGQEQATYYSDVHRNIVTGKQIGRAHV